MSYNNTLHQAVANYARELVINWGEEGQPLRKRYGSADKAAEQIATCFVLQHGHDARMWDEVAEELSSRARLVCSLAMLAEVQEIEAAETRTAPRVRREAARRPSLADGGSRALLYGPR